MNRYSDISLPLSLVRYQAEVTILTPNGLCNFHYFCYKIVVQLFLTD
jgi:hypothetical protein